jgi:cell division protein FtsN
MKLSHSNLGPPSARQSGGTLLGIIIGALLGLGAALAVAVYVTKVPVPFINKSQPHSAESDAAETKKNRDWDPNAPLAGKNPARAAVPALPPASAPDPAVVLVPAAPASSAKAARSGESSDPLGDLAKAKTAAKAAKPVDSAATSASVDPFNYFVQAGAFRTPEDAEQQRVKLSLLGFQARVTEREQSGRTVYRVRLGPFDKKDDAEQAKDKLDGNSIETALVRVQR